MTNICPKCLKGSLMVGRYSNAVRATKFNPCGKKRKYPNLQWAHLPDGKRIKMCTSCIKKGDHLKVK